MYNKTKGITFLFKKKIDKKDRIHYFEHFLGIVNKKTRENELFKRDKKRS